MVPAFGWTMVDSDQALDVPAVRVERGGNTLSNATVRVDIDDVTGTISVNGHADVGRLVDGGDAGDTYNWCPPAHDAVVDTPRRVVVLVLDSDPNCGRVAIDRTYRLGRRVIDGQRADPVDGIIRTVVELRAGESFVRVAVEVDNVWRDHRLRMIVPLAHPATHSEAECAFTAVERGLDAEGGPTELAMPTFPARRFVRAGGVTIAHDAVNEYELVDIRAGSDGVRRAHALALTVLRATGMLSQGPMDTRPEPAGPELPLEGPQLAGRVLRRFAIAVDDVDPYALADAFTPFPMVWAPGGGTRARTGSFLQVDGAEVSAVRHECGRTLVRVFNPAPTERDVRVPGRRGQVVDLTGRVIDDFDGVLALRPHGIATIALEPRPPSDA
jgi:alpha-mannosidase